MKYIDFESLTVTWLHEANMIVEDQLTHNFKRRSRTAHPRPYLTLQCKMWAEAGNDSVLSCPWHWRAGLWKLDWLRLSIVSLLWFTFIVLWNVLGVQSITRIVQPITRRDRFRSVVLKIQRIEEFSMGFEGNGKFIKIYSSASCP